MGRRGGLGAAALVLLLGCQCAWAQVVVEEGSSIAASTYDPCLAPPTGVKSGSSFVFGLAYWPGGTLADWGEVYNATTGAPGLNPCLDLPVLDAEGKEVGTYQSYLSERGVVFGTFMVKVDTLASARATRAEMDAIWRQLLKNVDDEPVISVIAFRGQNRSEPAYVRSNSSAITAGTGIVQQLSLIVSWDRGTFNGFTWYNAGPCDACGGLRSGECVQTQYEPTYQKYTQSSCAYSFEECACDTGLQCAANNCTSTVYVGHRGSDAPGRTMDSGFQIEQINKYSLTSFFWKLLDSVYDLLGNSGTGTVGSGTTAQPTITGATGETDEALAQAQTEQAATAGAR